jgi:3-dehydroquinate synthase
MKTIQVKASKTYNVYIGTGLLERAGELIRPVLRGEAAMVVTDDAVAPLYLERLKAALAGAGLRVYEHVVPRGEASKNAENYLKLLSAMAERGITRADAVIALGGGVTGDLAGFAAATYMRGIGFIQIPTTLLAAVDASVGGKTAIDLPQGKNLAGAFYQPDAVVCDVSLLDTLPEPVFQDGMAEVVKYAFIAETPLLEMLKSPVKPKLEDIIALSVSIKRDIVCADERESGERKLLNFGHTIGHAIEKCSGYTVPHGRAVAAGMAVITRAAVRAGLCLSEVSVSLEELLLRHNLPVDTHFSARELAEAALADKKRSGDAVSLVLPVSPGRCVIREMPTDALEAFIAPALGKSAKGGEGA